MTYKLTSGWPKHIPSGAFVNPNTNLDYLAWLAEDNTPEPADPEPAPIDQADIDNLEKKLKALAMTFAQITNTPLATVRTIFRNKMEQLP